MDRLVDLWVKYSGRVRGAEERLAAGEDTDEARLSRECFSILSTLIFSLMFAIMCCRGGRRRWTMTRGISRGSTGGSSRCRWRALSPRHATPRRPAPAALLQGKRTTREPLPPSPQCHAGGADHGAAVGHRAQRDQRAHAALLRPAGGLAPRGTAHRPLASLLSPHLSSSLQTPNPPVRPVSVRRSAGSSGNTSIIWGTRRGRRSAGNSRGGCGSSCGSRTRRVRRPFPPDTDGHGHAPLDTAACALCRWRRGEWLGERANEGRRACLIHV